MKASNSDTCFWIKASPRGTRSGFAVLPDGADGRVTVTVLPKPWAAKPGAMREYVHRPGSTTHVVMHETELAALRTTSSSVGALTLSLTDLLREQGGLLELSGRPSDPVLPTVVSGDPFGDLIDLMLIAERGRVTTSPLMFEGSFAPSLLRLLSQERLLKVVEGLIFRARPRYAERTENLGMPRGRLSEGSLLYSLATGTPRVESTFDELTMDTPLLQMVACALRVVASELLPRKITALLPSLQTRAAHLLLHLSGVSLIDRDRALLIAERIWLSPLDRFWEPAIDAAVPVLRGRAVVPNDGDESSEAILVRISTEKFWEQCLELALESAFKNVAVSRDGQPGEGVSVPAPWAPRTAVAEVPTEVFPDFMFRASHRVVVADAKYKLGGGDAPSSSDGYQLFAYSHLATMGAIDSDLALILCPVRVGDRPRQFELERMRDRAYPLWFLRLPFPNRADVQSPGNWSAYMGRLTRTIREFSMEWMVRRDESPDIA